MTISRCTGHCCEGVPFGSAALEVLTTPDIIAKHPTSIREHNFVNDMAIVTGDTNDGDGYIWTCRHFDTTTRNCTVYDQRPWVCRNHGVEYPCTTDGCEWTDAKREADA